MTTATQRRLDVDKLRDFCRRVFEKMGVAPQDALATADNLVTADLRGIHSHGVARLKRYVDGLKNGVMIARPDEKIVRETPVSVVIDAGAGLGQPVSKRAMQKAIEKAKKSGVGFAAVRNSNHYGIAGYYSMMALEEGMMGFSTTNTAVLVVPTFGKDALMGTNPISVAIPAGKERPYVLDMATSTVPRGKLEVYNRQEKEIPPVWATDENGNPTTDPGRVLKNMLDRAGGGLAPLGGTTEETGGHKGYGLMLLVEILTGVLTGAAFADQVYPRDSSGKPLPANLGHLFAALRIDLFRDPEDFKSDMDVLLGKLKNSSKAEGEDRIYIHGEKEYEKAEENAVKGVPIHPKVIATMKQIAEQIGVEHNF